MDITKIKEWAKKNPKMSAVIGLIVFMFFIRGCSGGHSTSNVQGDDLEKNRVTITALEEMSREAENMDLSTDEKSLKSKDYLYERALELIMANYVGKTGEPPKLYATLSMPDKFDYSAYKPGILVRKVVVKNFGPSSVALGHADGIIRIGVPRDFNEESGNYSLKFRAISHSNDINGGSDREFEDCCSLSFDDMNWEISMGKRTGVISHSRAKLKGQIEMEVVPEGIRIRYVDDGKVLKEYISKKHQPAIYFACWSSMGSADVEYYR